MKAAIFSTLSLLLVIVQLVEGFIQVRPVSTSRNSVQVKEWWVQQSKWQTVIPSGPRSLKPLAASPRKIDVGGEGLSTFGRDLTKHDLLTAADEMSLARQYKLGVNVQAQRDIMSSDLGRPATDSEVAAALGIKADQVKYILEKGEDAKRVLVKTNMRLVFHICKYYRFRGVAYPDLVQEGTFGLIKAVDKYDPERGFRFSTYASWWIKQSVSRAIAEKSRIVRLPVHIHDLMVSLNRVERQFTAQNARKPTPHELAERLALPIQKVELLVKCSRDVNSMDVNIYDNKGKMNTNNEQQVKDRIASDGNEPSSLNERNCIRNELRRAMQSLSEREAQIVEMRFGLADGNQMTLEEIGKQFNVTRERIRQIEARALSKMRNPMKANEIREIFQDNSLLTRPMTQAMESYADVV